MKKTKPIVRTEIFSRFLHVVLPTEERPNHRVQAVAEDGKLLTMKCTPSIHKRVLGERRSANSNHFHLGLRQLTAVKFRAHYSADDVIQSLDIIPNRMFTSGAAPRAAGRAATAGFDVHWDDTIQGFDVYTLDPDSGEKLRVAYAGMSEKRLCEVLDAMRAATWGSKTKHTLADHRIEKTEENSFKVRPAVPVKYTT